MSATLPPPATLDDLMRVDGKAELINGRVVHIMPSGYLPGEVALEIVVRLRDYARATRIGVALGDNVGYALRPAPRAGRQSFAPDASYYTGPLPANRMRFIEGAPDLAVEVRSENDYGPAAEQELADKRAEYFAAGTLVVWDVDPLARAVTSYRADAPDAPAVYGPGGVAEAEPACPGWRVPVADLFPGNL